MLRARGYTTPDQIDEAILLVEFVAAAFTEGHNGRRSLSDGNRPDGELRRVPKRERERKNP